MSSNGSYPLKLSNLAIKQLKKIRKTDRVLYDKVNNAVTAIRLDPSIGEPKKGDLKSYYCVDISHLRTNYEICYTLVKDINDQLVLIIMMGTRENFYSNLKRYLNG